MNMKKKIVLTAVLPVAGVLIISFIAGDFFTGSFEKKWINTQIEKKYEKVESLFNEYFSILRSPEKEIFTALVMKMQSWGELNKFFIRFSPIYPQLEKISVSRGGNNIAGISKLSVNSFGYFHVNKKTSLSNIFLRGEIPYAAFEIVGPDGYKISGIIELSSLFEKASGFAFSPAGSVKFYSRPRNYAEPTAGTRSFPLLNGLWSVEFTDDFQDVYKIRSNFRNIFILFAVAVFFLMYIISVSYARRISFRLALLRGDSEMSGGEDEISVISKQIAELHKTQNELRRQISLQDAVGILGKNVSMIGHELRNPLAAIKNAQYFISSQLTEEIKKGLVGKHLLIIKNEIKLISSMVEDLLTLSRVKPPVYAECDINALINESVDLFAADTQLIDFTVSPGRTYKVSADASEIKQVFLNIIRNACEAITPPGEIKIEIGEQENFVRIKFTDTGCGIPPDKQEEIWKPFFSTKSSGMGFGLSTVKRIVEERHKGKVEIKSRAGKGTEITIYLLKEQE